jgi:hypothetical protein
MNHTAFMCKRCGAELTDFLQELSETSIFLETGKAMIPPAHFVRLTQAWSYREFVTGRKPDHHYPSADGDMIVFEAGDFLLNISDVSHLISKGAIHGCCGWQPRHEANSLCANRHEIGTIHSDECWSPVVFRLIRHAVVELTV